MKTRIFLFVLTIFAAAAVLLFTVGAGRAHAYDLLDPLGGTVPLTSGFSTTIFSAGEPIFMEGNVSCSDLHYSQGKKVEPVNSGTYYIDALYPVTLDVDDSLFDWTSTLPIDVVIVKGGVDTYVYTYAPEALSDFGLHAPSNCGTGDNQCGLSHVEFCYDYELMVTKTASPSLTRTYDWDIEKSVTPERWDLFDGEQGTSEYTVTVTKDNGTDSDWAVSGTISIYNPFPYGVFIYGIGDAVNQGGTVTGVDVIDCGVEFPYVLASGSTLNCTYSGDLPSGANGENRVDVIAEAMDPEEWYEVSDYALADVDFSEATISEVNPSINVADTNAQIEWNFDESGTQIYTKTFDCSEISEYVDSHAMYTWDNTATILETGQYADASVDVHCYLLITRKSAETEYARMYTWTIGKTGDVSTLNLPIGEMRTINYSLSLNSSYEDGEWGVYGTVEVYNPTPMTAEIAGITDVMGTTPKDLDCPDDFPVLIDSGEVFTCTYQVDGQGMDGAVNTATTAQAVYSYDSEGTPTSIGTRDYVATADVRFSSPTDVIDECVNVTDSLVSSPGTVCADDVISWPKIFTYSYLVGPYTKEQCGSYAVDNTGAFVTNDTGATGQDSWHVGIQVPCVWGCTSTLGYWKTHSTLGPARYDRTWALVLPGGENTLFFSTGQKWIQVLNYKPKSGDAYYILAHQYIAARLNKLSGASVPGNVETALARATVLFTTYSPAQVGLKGKSGDALRAEFIFLASVLDSYNNGYIGPGHCE